MRGAALTSPGLAARNYLGLSTILYPSSLSVSPFARVLL